MSRPRRAVILAAGRGTRMGEMTSDTPKPMLSLRGRPMLEHVLDNLEAAGFNEFLIVTGYHREKIERHFENWRLPIQFRLQEVPNGTGAAARLARPFAGDEPFLLTFGDIICEPAAYLRSMDVIDEHPATRAVLGVKYVDDPWQGAAVYADTEGRITKVVEKPPRGTSSTCWNSAGLFALAPVAFDYLERLELSPRGEYELTGIFDPMLDDGLELRISPIEGAWRDVGRPEDLSALDSFPEPPDHP
jgi:NDP-sugar pyrophosphorylase family protein